VAGGAEEEIQEEGGIEEAAEASANGGVGGRVLGALARPVPDERSHGQTSV